MTCLAIAGALVVSGCGESETATETETTQAVVVNKPAPGLPYLLYASDRDGDDEVYGVRADGKRTVQITRDESDLDTFELLLSPDWQWLYFLDDDYQPHLISTDGHRTSELAKHRAFYEAFSRDGKLLAYSEDYDESYPREPRIWLTRIGSGRSQVIGRGEPWSLSPDGSLLAVFTFPDDDSIHLRLLNTAFGREIGALDTPVSTDDALLALGWSPSGHSFAFEVGSALLLVDFTGDSWATRTVLRDARLNEDTWDETDARWLDDETLAVQFSSEVDDEFRSELLTVDLEGDATVLVDVRDYRNFVWSPDGSRVAFVEPHGESRQDLVTMTKTGSDRRVVFQAPYMSLYWTPDGRLLVQHERGAKKILELVDLDGTAEEVFRSKRYEGLGYSGVMSPDGRFLSLGTSEGSSTSGGVIGILSLADGSVVRIPVSGNVEVIGWADSRVGGARAPSNAPPVEVADGNELRSDGEIAEISASGSRVAAIAEPGRLDCHHVVAWTAGSSRVIRFSEPRRCGSDGENVHGDEESVAIELEGTKVSWTGVSWGNFVYVGCHTADVLHPEAGVSGGGGDEGWEGSGPDRPPPEQATRGGVSVKVEGGTVVLVRASDGRTRTINAPGDIVDAELENEGLFYAYNTSGKMKGHIVFVPFARLFG